MKSIKAIGVIETQYFTFALELLDEMVKTSNVQFLSSEKYLGGRLVTVIVGGHISDVEVAIQAAKEKANARNLPLKMAITITNPHEEILKFIVPDNPEKMEQEDDLNEEPVQNKNKKKRASKTVKKTQSK